MRFLHAASIATALFESLQAGTWNGWPSLQYVLAKEGYFSQWCTKHEIVNSTEVENGSRSDIVIATNTCPAAEERFNSVFLVSVAWLNISTIVFAYILDRFGTWVARTLCCVLLFTGYLMLWIMDVDRSWMLFPAMALISSSGLLLLVTNTQLGNLVPKHRSFYVTLINGVFDSGAVVLLVLQIAYSNGMDPKIFYALMTAVACLCAIRTFILMPKKVIPYPLLDKNISYGITECNWKENENKGNSSEPDIDDKIDKSENDPFSSEAVDSFPDEHSLPSFTSCLCSKIFIGHSIFYCTCYLRYSFMMGSLITWLRTFQTESGVGYFTEVLGYILTCGALVAPINGLIADLVMKYYRPRLDETKVIILRGLLVQVTLTAGLQILLSVAILAKVPFPSFVLLIFFKSFLFGTAFSFVAQAFPIEHFGKLMGVTQALVGVSSLLQYPLYKLATDVENGFTVVNTVLLLSSIACLSLPICLYVKSYKVNLGQKLCNDSQPQDAL